MSNMMKVATRDIAEELAGYQDLAWLVLPDSEKQVYIRQAQHIFNWRKTIEGRHFAIAILEFPKQAARGFHKVVYVAGEEER